MLLISLFVTLALAQDSELERGIVDVNEEVAVAQPAYARRHALIIGINAYTDPAFSDLGYAVADSEAVAEILIGDYGFAQDDVLLILNEDATKDAIEEALEDWACDYDRIGEDDLLVVFFAGHGVTRDLRSRGARGYLVPADGRARPGAGHEWSSLLGMNDLEDVAEAIPAKHVLFILDCCFGGLAVQRSPAPVAAGLSNRARQVITAGNADQAVLDAGGGGHSVFTGALLDALRGDADLDGDQVITFGELFNHIGRDVERKTEMRQTPLQASLPDHEGGNVALFAPSVTPGTMTAAERLRQLEQTTEEQNAELRRMADLVLAGDLIAEADELWPPHPEMIPRYRAWIAGAKSLLERKPKHEESVRQVRQEAYLSQVVSGQLEQGEGSAMDWSLVDPDLRWRYQTFAGLVTGLERLEAGLLGDDTITQDQGWSVPKRLAFAEKLREGFAPGGEYDLRWKAAATAIREAYPDLSLEPQMGLVPLAADRDSGLWEFGHLQSGAEPQRKVSGSFIIKEDTGLVFVLLPGGWFLMGAQARDPAGPNFDPGMRSMSGPVHEVILTPFFLSKYEMTQGQWLRATGNEPSTFSSVQFVADQLRHPVETVTWNECVDACQRLSLQLPSEAQWEYGARGGTQTPWWTGADRDSLLEMQAANLADQAAKRIGAPWGDSSCRWPELDDGYPVHAPVSTLTANPFGLHHVHGNVWELCLDGADETFYSRSPSLNPLAPPASSSNRSSRGGSFQASEIFATSAYRDSVGTDGPDLRTGLRPMRVIEPVGDQ